MEWWKMCRGGYSILWSDGVDLAALILLVYDATLGLGVVGEVSAERASQSLGG